MKFVENNKSIVQFAEVTSSLITGELSKMLNYTAESIIGVVDEWIDSDIQFSCHNTKDTFVQDNGKICVHSDFLCA